VKLRPQEHRSFVFVDSTDGLGLVGEDLGFLSGPVAAGFRGGDLIRALAEAVAVPLLMPGDIDLTFLSS
jgi:hypothetical protein